MIWNKIQRTRLGDIVFKKKWLLSLGGRRIDLHKMTGADEPECFHTHPARAIRIILWGGYAEELYDGSIKVWRPGMIGYVPTHYTHRVNHLLNGRLSISLWARGKDRAPILLFGKGWKKNPRASEGSEG